MVDPAADKPVLKLAQEKPDLLGVGKNSLPPKVEAKVLAPIEIDPEDEEKKTEVLGKAILDPESNPCKL